MKQELLPCPFCGESASRLLHSPYSGEYIECPDCLASSGFFRKQSEAVKHWNTRHTPDYLQTIAKLSEQLGLSNGRERALVATLQEVNKGIVKIAAAMIRADDQPSRYSDDIKFPKTTPIKARVAHLNDNRKNNDISHARGLQLSLLMTKIKLALKECGVQ